MTGELEEIRERQEQLERYVNLLETRVDLQESLMRLYTARREPKALPEVGEAPPSGQDPELKGFDFVLRSILSQQGMHSTDIRKAVRGLESMTAKLNSVEEMLRRVDHGVQALGTQEEAS